MQLGLTSTEEGVVVKTWVRNRYISWLDIGKFHVLRGKNAVQHTHTLHIELEGGKLCESSLCRQAACPGRLPTFTVLSTN